MFGTKYNRDGLNNLEPGGGKRITESAGYIPPQKQIESFILAGRRLNEARKEMFDFPDGVEDPEFSDPTRSPGFDLVDAQKAMQTAKAGLREASEKKAAEIKAAKEAEAKEFEEFKNSKNSKKEEPKE